MSAALKAMNGFGERLDGLVSVMVDELGSGLGRRILNTKSDMTVLDDFTRALPGMWSNDCGQTFANTEDLVDMFLTTRETVDGTKSASALRADSELSKKLDALNKEFTLLFVPRTVTWCNYAKSSVCSYVNGKCQPAVTSRMQPRNDVEFFVGEVLEVCQSNKDVLLKWAPRNISFEFEEETFTLQYGLTTDNTIWIGTAKYW